MILSSNEIDAMVRKAFRGAGYQWGEAEEAGKAALWLVRHGIEAGDPIVSLLQAAKGNVDRLRPACDPDRGLNAQDLCPILLGIALADGAIVLDPGKPSTLGCLHAPSLLLPFLSDVARATGQSVELAAPCLEATVFPKGVDLRRVLSEARNPTPATLTLIAPGISPSASTDQDTRKSTFTAASWETLNHFAGFTYVPASEHSRLSGAGAGVTDKD